MTLREQIDTADVVNACALAAFLIVIALLCWKVGN
jgi:hypothetical protein